MHKDHRKALMQELLRVGYDAVDAIRDGAACKRPCTCCTVPISPSAAYDACRLALKALSNEVP